MSTQKMTDKQKIDALVEALRNTVEVLTIYVYGGNPNSPYKEGRHNCYVFGSKEALDNSITALAQVEKG